MARVAALLLAAGASTRFGTPKQLAPVGDKTLLQRCIDTANQVLPEHTYVVLGAHRKSIAATVSNGCIIENTRWRQGLGCSIACGVRALEQHYDGILILLADQVHIRVQHVETLLAAFTGDNMVCAFYEGQRGVPTIFPSACFTALQQLTGDQGAKILLQYPPYPIVDIHLPDAVVDIDTPEDLVLANP